MATKRSGWHGERRRHAEAAKKTHKSWKGDRPIRTSLRFYNAYDKYELVKMIVAHLKKQGYKTRIKTNPLGYWEVYSDYYWQDR